ncbi:MAG TPA: hypothetical protein PK156_50205 [Polyangium sp.]|nr:hypothetical protein [Polyangium sp.]
MQWSMCSYAGSICAALLLNSSFAYGQTADEKKAEELFNKAIELSEARKYDEACPLIGESQKLDPRPGTLFAWADCEREGQRIKSSVEHFKAYLKQYEGLKPDVRKRHAQRANSARGYVKTLEPQIPTLKLTFAGGLPAGSVITRNGVEVDRATLDSAVPLDPGEHVFVVKVPGHADAEQRVTLAVKDKKVVEFAAGAAIETGSQPIGEEKRKTNVRRTVGFVLLGTGTAGLIFGGVMGGLALGQKNVVQEHCADLDCDPTGLDAVNQGRSFGNMSTIGLAAGGVIAASGLVLVLTAPKAKPKTGWITGVGGTASLDGAFLSVEGQF